LLIKIPCYKRQKQGSHFCHLILENKVNLNLQEYSIKRFVTALPIFNSVSYFTADVHPSFIWSIFFWIKSSKVFQVIWRILCSSNSRKEGAFFTRCRSDQWSFPSYER